MPSFFENEYYRGGFLPLPAQEPIAFFGEASQDDINIRISDDAVALEAIGVSDVTIALLWSAANEYEAGEEHDPDTPAVVSPESFAKAINLYNNGLHPDALVRSSVLPRVVATLGEAVRRNDGSMSLLPPSCYQTLQSASSQVIH